jgi:hypothetical protein
MKANEDVPLGCGAEGSLNLREALAWRDEHVAPVCVIDSAADETLSELKNGVCAMPIGRRWPDRQAPSG